MQNYPKIDRTEKDQGKGHGAQGTALQITDKHYSQFRYYRIETFTLLKFHY